MMSGRSPLVWLERLLFLVGVVCLAWFGYATVWAAAVQREQQTRFEQALASSPAAAVNEDGPEPVAARDRTIDDGDEGDASGVLGLLEIPRIGLSVTVMHGDGEEVLSAAAGHLPDTPRPWEPGNSAIAAHRDSWFRPLKGIRRGDLIRLRTRRGDLEYRVDELKIVTPTELSVLAPRKTDSVTLITCYPFNYVGAAPKRFVVHAERTGGHAASPDRLASRSLAAITGYRTAARMVPAVMAIDSAPARAAARARERASTSPHVSARSKRQARASRNAHAGSLDAPSKKKAPSKPRRWYHFFRGR